MAQPSNAVALVTGASRGLGFLLARELADRGHDLVICARDQDGIDTAAADLRGTGRNVVAVAADIGVEAEAVRVVQRAISEFGRLDVLVCNAGVIQVGPVTALTPEDYAQAMDVMYWGLVHPALAAMPELRKRRGRILAVTSLGGKLPAPHLLPYVGAKHAAVGFAEGLRVELAAQGVSVTVGVPGLMRTGSPRNAMVVGNRQAEYEWFTALGSLPLISTDAERASRRLIDATMKRRPEVVLTPAAQLSMRLHGLAPATTMRMITFVNKLLPEGTDTGARPAHENQLPGWLEALARLNRKAAERLHQHDDESKA